MEIHVLVPHLVIFLLLNLSLQGRAQSVTQTNPRTRKSERTVVFLDSNDTEHSLPVFPDPVVEYVGSQLPIAPPVDKYGRPLCAKDAKTTFCESVENYPQKQIRKAINYSTEEFVEVFGPPLGVMLRKNGDLNEDTVCPTNTRLFYPKAAVNENDHWAYVINDVDYVQTVMAEICMGDADQPCRFLDGRLPEDFTSRCRQKYAYKRLLALHPNKKRTYTDQFRFPSCCVCYVKKPFVLSRSRDIVVEDQDPAEKSKSMRERNPVQTNRSANTEKSNISSVK